MSPELDDLDEVLRMTHFLSAEVGYRDLSRTQNQQCLSVSRRLWREGLNERLLRMLLHYAESCGDNPTRLFCWWLDRSSRVIEKVNEMREKEGWLARTLAKQESPRNTEAAPILEFRKRVQ